jgi:hypothetical protein
MSVAIAQATNIYRLIFAKPLLADFPIGMSQDIIAVYGHRILIVQQAIGEIETSCERTSTSKLVFDCVYGISHLRRIIRSRISG